MKGPRRRHILAPLLSLILASPVAGLAQAPGTLAPAANPLPSKEVGTSADLPPSSVSPAIARFVEASGRDTVPASTASSPPSLGPLQDPGMPGLPPASPEVKPANPPTRSSEDKAPNPLETSPRLKAPGEPTDKRYPINLATALRLSDARPLIVAAAQASVWIAEADLTRAKVLWVPSANFAADYIRHDGGGPDFNKGIMTAPSVNYFYAGGSFLQSVNLTDVIFQPLAARQVLNSRHWDVQTAKNDALQQTADAYFQVHQARGVYSGALYTVERGRNLVQKVTTLSQDLVPRFEIERARNLLADLEQQAVLARQEWRVQSANLTQVLRLDPRVVVEPLEQDHAQVTLIDPGRELEELMSVALANRPELAARRALVEAAELRIRREKARPFLPLFLLNGFQSSGGMLIQGGIFGIGSNNSLNQFRGRDDVSVQMMWQLEGLGVGNLAKVKAQRGQQSRATIELRQTQDRIGADVTRAQARVQSGATRLLQADRALRSGIITFNGQIEGLSQTRRFGDVLVLTYRPQETVYALYLLNIAFHEYFSTVAEYNRAQFELYHAVGYPARELAQLRPPGEVLPVDISRPAYLPPVGHGPPPATR